MQKKYQEVEKSKITVEFFNKGALKLIARSKYNRLRIRSLYSPI